MIWCCHLSAKMNASIGGNHAHSVKGTSSQVRSTGGWILNKKLADLTFTLISGSALSLTVTQRSVQIPQ